MGFSQGIAVPAAETLALETEHALEVERLQDALAAERAETRKWMRRAVEMSARIAAPVMLELGPASPEEPAHPGFDWVNAPETEWR